MRKYLDLFKIIMEQYKLHPTDSLHGVQHWGRVYEIGRAIANKNGGNVDVVKYFGLLHDCCRENEGKDPDHGRRAAKFAEAHRDLIDLDDDAFKLLLDALAGHVDNQTSDDPTIGCCWDGDRLDLGRVNIKPNYEQLSSNVAKDPDFFTWAISLHEKDE